MARSVNFVWNYCNDVQKHALKWNKRWPSGFDLNKLTAGSYKDLGLHSGTVNAVAEQYVRSLRAKNRPHLRYRGKKSLGWVPFKGRSLKLSGNDFKFYGADFSVWLSRCIPDGAKIKDGSSFSQDSRGRWYINIVIEAPGATLREMGSVVGIDLGLKALATLSSGETIAAPRLYRATEKRLGTAQRARKRNRIRALHAKIANQRKDYLHKVSTDLIKRFDHIVVGDVSGSKLAQTNMAKSVHDAGWHNLKTMLAYKSLRNGVRYEEVDEAYSSRACSTCGSLSGPKGINALGIREWTCGDCGALHNRDTNAALNILRRGHATPVAGIAA